MEYANDRPIYLQIVDEIVGDILSGKINLGDKLPSIREIALEKKVNPNTIQRSMGELEKLGLTYTQRGVGNFIVEDDRVIRDLKKDLLKTKINEFLEEMAKYGVEKEEIIKMIKGE